MDETAPLPIRCSVEPIRLPETRAMFGFDPSKAEAYWAYVDELHLAEQLRPVPDSWDALALQRNAARSITDRFGVEPVTKLMIDRLCAITNATASPARP